MVAGFFSPDGIWQRVKMLFFNRPGRMLLVTDEYARDAVKHPTVPRMEPPSHPTKKYPVQMAIVMNLRKLALVLNETTHLSRQ